MKKRECCAYVFRSFFRRGSTVKSKPGESLPVFLLCDSLKSMKTSEQNCTADLSGRGEETDWGWVPIESILCLGPDVQRMNPRSLLVYRKPSVKLVMTSFGWWRQDQCSSEFSRDQWDPVQAQSKGWCPGVYSRCGDGPRALLCLCTTAQLTHRGTEHSQYRTLHCCHGWTYIFTRWYLFYIQSSLRKQ